MFKKVISEMLEYLGYVRHSQYSVQVDANEKLTRELKQIELKNRDLDALNRVISEELKILTDENKSLWDMLDETKMLTDEMLKDFKPVGEA